MSQVISEKRLEEVEASLHGWVIDNIRKHSYDMFWWRIKPEFIQEALKKTGVSEQEYEFLRISMDSKIRKPTYSE